MQLALVAVACAQSQRELEEQLDRAVIHPGAPKLATLNLQFPGFFRRTGIRDASITAAWMELLLEQNNFSNGLCETGAHARPQRGGPQRGGPQHRISVSLVELLRLAEAVLDGPARFRLLQTLSLRIHSMDRVLAAQAGREGLGVLREALRESSAQLSLQKGWDALVAFLAPFQGDSVSNFLEGRAFSTLLAALAPLDAALGSAR